MISLPWQLIAVFVASFSLHLVLCHFRKANCDDRVEAAKRQQHRDTMAIYRDGYCLGWEHGKADSAEIKDSQ